MGHQRQQATHSHEDGDLQDAEEAQCGNPLSTEAAPTERYIYEMMSPCSLLRSDRFARSKAVVGEAIQAEASSFASMQLQNSGRKPDDSADRGSRIISSVTTAPKPLLRGEEGLEGTNSKRRGRAPARTRSRTAIATKTVPHGLDHQKRGERSSRNDFGIGLRIPLSETITNKSSTSATASCRTDTASTPSHTIQPRQGRSPSPLTDSQIMKPCCRVQISQSPLRPSSAPSKSVLDGQCQQYVQSESTLTAAGLHSSTWKISESERIPCMDDWNARCLKLAKQIAEHFGGLGCQPSSFQRPDVYNQSLRRAHQRVSNVE